MSLKSADGWCTVIESIGTATPQFTVPQRDAMEFMLRTDGLSEAIRKRIPLVYSRSGIEFRHTVLEDYVRKFEEFNFYPRSQDLLPSPSTRSRNELYIKEAVPLAQTAARACINESGANLEDITHLIVVSCTGFFAPGLDIHLVRNLGLRNNTQRTIVGFMGCYAAFNAMRLADSICKSTPGASVLIVCVELCTLHFQIKDNLESVVVNALFSDGAAAILMRRRAHNECARKFIYRDHESLLDEDSLDAMSWSIGDTGYIMGLSPAVPELIDKRLPKFVDILLERSKIDKDSIDFWAVHPGGRQILDKVTSTMSLSQCQIEDSYGVLRAHGNMSSPTVLYVLKELEDRLKLENKRDQTLAVALAFGPGLTIEGSLLEFVA